MESRENLKSCIEYCTLVDSSKPVGFYFDSRFGMPIEESNMHPIYKKCVHFEAKPVIKVNRITREESIFTLSILTKSDTNEIIECQTVVKYFDNDKTFVSRSYDPVTIIHAILNDPTYKEFFVERNHPYYQFGYIANYNWAPISLIRQKSEAEIRSALFDGCKLYKADQNGGKENGGKENGEDDNKVDEIEWYKQYLRDLHNKTSSTFDKIEITYEDEEPNNHNLNDLPDDFEAYADMMSTCNGDENKEAIYTAALEHEKQIKLTRMKNKQLSPIPSRISYFFDEEQEDETEDDIFWNVARNIQEPNSESDKDKDDGSHDACSCCESISSENSRVPKTELTESDLEEIEYMFGSNIRSENKYSDVEDKLATMSNIRSENKDSDVEDKAKDLTPEPRKLLRKLPVHGTRIDLLRHRAANMHSSPDLYSIFKMSITSELETLKPYIPKLPEREDNLLF
jgi:hypothetical protein